MRNVVQGVVLILLSPIIGLGVAITCVLGGGYIIYGCLEEKINEKT